MPPDPDDFFIFSIPKEVERFDESEVSGQDGDAAGELP